VSKFEVKLVVDMLDMNETSALAAELVSFAGVPVESVDIRPLGHPAGLGFGERIAHAVPREDRPYPG
jgi:hypothetical protein